MNEFGSIAKRVLTTGVLALVTTVGFTSVGIGSAAASADVTPRGVVGVSDLGKITSTVKGKTSDGGRSPDRSRRPRVIERDGMMYVKGFLRGVKSPTPRLQHAFSGVKNIPIKKINGPSVTDARAVTARRRATSSTWCSARST